MATVPARVPSVWRIVVAAILDFLMVFIGVGFLIARATGETTPNGFRLEGTAALALFAVIALYFFVGRRYLGGTLWQRVLRARP